MSKKLNYSQKKINEKFFEKQQNIIQSISKKCNNSTFHETICVNNNELKHFILPDGTHVYSLNGEHPARLFSSTELPDITYFSDHWNPMLLPNSNLSKSNGTYIYADYKSVSYVSYLNGNLLFECGYNYDIDNINNLNYFGNFSRKYFGKTFKNLPHNVTNILEMTKTFGNKSKSFSHSLNSNLDKCINILSHIEKGTVNELAIHQEKSFTQKEH